MPNQIDNFGLHTKTLPEIIADLTTALQGIYGADINLDQNTPDGQLLNIFSQAQIDQLELLAAAYNSFDPDSAYGTVLDKRCAINGIERQAGTYTIQNIDVTTDRAVNLVGLDGGVNETGFTVADDAGNEFVLMESQTTGVGLNTYAFQAVNIGRVLTLPSTIENIVTVTLGVLSVTNPDPATTVGSDEETDTQLKVRRSKSFFMQSQGPADSLLAALINIADVSDAFVGENTSAAPANGIDGHSIWVIVENGTDAEIGQAIYAKKASGCGMMGAESYVISRPNSQTFTAKFDRPLYTDLYIDFTLVPKGPGMVFDTDSIKDQLVAVLIYKLNQIASSNDIVIAMQEITPQAYLTLVQVSIDGDVWDDYLVPSDYQHKFLVTADKITIGQ